MYVPLHAYKNIRSIMMVRAKQTNEIPQPTYVKTERISICVFGMPYNPDNHNLLYHMHLNSIITTFHHTESPL